MVNLVSMRSALLGVCALVFGSVYAITALAWFSAPPQNTTRVFEKRNRILPDVVSILEIETSNKRLMLGEAFHSGPDWLREAKFKLRNDSGKKIVHILFELEFPETQATGNVMTYQIAVGQRPGSIEASRLAPLSLKPDQELTITIDENAYAGLSRFVEGRQPLSTLSKAIVNIRFVAFDDDTGWSEGEYLRRNPNSPNRYFPIVKSPGR